MARTFPALNIENARLIIERIDRAEPRTALGTLPAHAFVRKNGAVVTCWPVKLVRAPEVADAVLALNLPRSAVQQSPHDPITQLKNLWPPLPGV